MNNKIKDYLGVAIIAVLFIFASAATSYVNTFSKSIQPSSFRSFPVSAEGKIVVIPDVAQFSFGVKTEGGKNIADLQKENTEKMNQAIEFIKSNGVEAKDIKTANYSLEPRYQYYNCSRSFVIDDQTLVQDQARNEAIAKAKTKAVSIAKAGGFRLGRLLSIEEGSTPIYYGYETMKAAGAGGEAAPTIEAGSQEVTVTMTLRYEIQ